jgi:hypothetical protein
VLKTKQKVLRELGPRESSTRANAPKTKTQRRLDKVSKANVEVMALLETKTPLAFPGMQDATPNLGSYFHHDRQKPAEALQILAASYNCSCAEPHIAGLRCVCSKCNPKFVETEPKSGNWDFEVAFYSSGVTGKG